MGDELRDRAFFVRHPVFNYRGRLAAFHLSLLGRIPGRVALNPHRTQEAVEDVAELFSQISWNRMLQGHRLFLPLTPPLLIDEIMRPLPPRKTIVALDWRLIRELEWMDWIKQIRLYHFDLAVHNYDFSEPLPLDEYRFDHVAVDIQAAGPQRIIENMPKLYEESHWIACRVNTRKQFEVCSRFGFAWLEGRFYLKPPRTERDQMEEETFRPSEVKVLQLLSRVDDPRLNLEEIALILEQDVALSERVVELVNATTLRPGDEPISSVLDAVRRLGVKQLKSWLETLVVGELGREMPEVVRASLIRAAFLRCMGRMDPNVFEDVYYTIGLFSLLDVILKRDMVEILRSLNLSEVIMEAILEKQGRPGLALQVIEALEGDDREAESVPLKLPRGVVPAQVNKCYLKALDYADKILISLRLAGL